MFKIFLAEKTIWEIQIWRKIETSNAFTRWEIAEVAEIAAAVLRLLTKIGLLTETLKPELAKLTFRHIFHKACSASNSFRVWPEKHFEETNFSRIYQPKNAITRIGIIIGIGIACGENFIRWRNIRLNAKIIHFVCWSNLDLHGVPGIWINYL